MLGDHLEHAETEQHALFAPTYHGAASVMHPATEPSAEPAESLQSALESKRTTDVECPSCGTVNHVSDVLKLRFHTCINCKAELPLPRTKPRR